MLKLKRMVTWVAVLPVCAAMAACTAWHTEKQVAVPQRPQVYSLSVKLMDVNGIDQELGRIPLLIEETREGGRITKVRVEPTGDIRLPGMGVDGDKAFRWEVVSCDAARADEPYTLTLKLALCTYPGVLTQSAEAKNRTTLVSVGMYGNVAYARVLVHRAADGAFSMELKNDIISSPAKIAPEEFMDNPGFLQRDLVLKLVPMVE